MFSIQCWYSVIRAGQPPHLVRCSANSPATSQWPGSLVGSRSWCIEQVWTLTCYNFNVRTGVLLTFININEVGPLFKHQILNSASQYKPKPKADGDFSARSLFLSVGQSAVYFGQCPFLPQRNNDENYRYWHRKLTHKLWRFLLDILMSPCHCILDFSVLEE